MSLFRYRDSKGQVHEVLAFKGDKGDTYNLTEQDKKDVANMVEVDQTYNPESENAQSGIAVAQAFDKRELKLIKNITLEEDVTDINVTFDKGLKEIAVFMTVSFDVASNTKAICARSDDGTWYMFYEFLNLTTTPSYFYMHSKEVRERYWETIGVDTLKTTLQGLEASFSNTRFALSRRGEAFSRYVKDLNIFVAGRTEKFATGSVIEIWGVEADESLR